VLVSPATGDDAAVIALPDGRALILTVDFFTPIVDDPFDWGRIAATNAFSDVYAMGGTPILALNLVAWPVKDLPLSMLSQVMEGGGAAAREASVLVIGGHSIHDPEPKYGMAVTGFVDPKDVVRNSTMRPGDRLYLTKPLGLGIITTGVKRRLATPEQLAAAVETMTTTNAAGARVMVEVGVSAATDVTGFGLMGHLHIGLAASEASAVLFANAVPFLPGTMELAEQDAVPSGTKSNHSFVSPSVDWGELPPLEQLMLADAQTSGGLLIAVPAERADVLQRALVGRGISGAEVGVVGSEEPGHIRVTGRVVRAEAGRDSEG
jgi:selenide, water dikinase